MKKKPNAGKLLSVALVLTLAAGGCGTTTQKEPPGSSAGEHIQALKELVDGKPYYTSGRINTQGR